MIIHWYWSRLHSCPLLQPRFWKLVPQAFCSRSLGFPERERITIKRVLLLDNTPYHPRECTDFWWWPHCCKVFAFNITALIQLMDQGVITSMKWCYQADLLGTFADEDDSITALWKKDGVGCCIWHISSMVFCESSNTGSLMILFKLQGVVP
jgi:hypothetical protein